MSRKSPMKDPDIMKLGGEKIRRGERKQIMLETASLYDYTKLSIPVEIIRGKNPGPVLFISAAIHGDEINGVEIIRRLLKKKFLNKIKGTLILVPVVNVFGFNHRSRYLPDRRDLNRSFPGNANGSLGSRLAYIFMKEIVSKCTHGIDLHTGAIHRTNLPQVRAFMDNENTRNLAKAFDVPVVINSALRDGSLREAARQKNVAILLFEGGEALRFEEHVIRIGLQGCTSVMRKIGMLPELKTKKSGPNSKIYVAESSHWIRAPRSGTIFSHKKIGEYVSEGDVLASISDLFGGESFDVTAEDDGILIGCNLLPLVNQGDAMFHLATFKNTQKVGRALAKYDDFYV